MARRKDIIKKNSIWVTGSWRERPRRIQIDKLYGDDVSFTFIDDEAEPKQTSTVGRTAFFNTYIPWTEPT